MQARKISVALVGTSENIYDFINQLYPEELLKKDIKQEGRTWKEIEVPAISKTDKSWSCITVKLNNIEYNIYPRSNENFNDYLKHFQDQKDLAFENKKSGKGFQYPARFLWPNDKIIFCDVDEQDRKIAKQHCTEADIPFIDYKSGDAKEYLAKHNKSSSQSTFTFGSPTL